MVEKGYHLFFKNPKTKEGIEDFLRKEYKIALNTLKEVLQTDIDNPAVNYYTGMCYKKLGRARRAREFLKAAITQGEKPIHRHKNFIRHFVFKAKRALYRERSPRYRNTEVLMSEPDSKMSSFAPGPKISKHMIKSLRLAKKEMSVMCERSDEDSMEDLKNENASNTFIY